MDEKQLTINELFCGMPKLESSFRYLNWKISHYKHYQPFEGETKESLIEERDRLLKTAQELEIRDLRIIYYVRHLEDIRSTKICSLLKELYEVQQTLMNELTDQ